MKEAMIEFLVVYALVFVLYFFFFVFRRRVYDKGKMPVELKYLISVYKIKKKDTYNKKFLYVIAFVNSFIIAFTYIIVSKFVKGIFLQLIVGGVILLLLIIICYGIVGYIYKKRE